MKEWVHARVAVFSVRDQLYCDHAHEAEQKIEKALREDKIRSSQDGASLSCEDWAKRGSWPEGHYDEDGNWVEKYDREPCGEDEGPLSLMAHGIKLHHKDLEKWISSQKLKPSRPSGTSYEKLDAPLVEEMQTLIENGKASSRTEAAGLVSSTAKGASDDAKVHRLVKRHREKYGQ